MFKWNDIVAFYCNGNMATAARDRQLRMFRAHPAACVLIVSDVAGIGLNIAYARFVMPVVSMIWRLHSVRG